MKRKPQKGKIGQEIHSKPCQSTESTDPFFGEVAGYLLSPIILPVILIAVLIDALYWRLQLAIASRFPCQSCGTILGMDALERGKEDWKGYVAMWHTFGRVYDEFGICDLSRFNSRKFRLKHPHVVCCRCGVLYCFEVCHFTFKRQGLPVFNSVSL
jgi:hypothetical protein